MVMCFSMNVTYLDYIAFVIELETALPPPPNQTKLSHK